MLRLVLFISFFCLPNLWVFAAESTRSDFFEQAKLYQLRLSPSGHKIVGIRKSDDTESIVVIDSKSFKERTLFTGPQNSSNEVQINRVYWLDNRYIGVSLSEKVLGVQDLLDTSIKRQFVTIDSASQKVGDTPIYNVRSKGWFAHRIPREEGHFLFSKSGRKSNLYKIAVEKLALKGVSLGKLDKIDGGQFISKNVVTSVDGYVLRWFFDQRDQAVSALLFNVDGDLELKKIDDAGESSMLFSWAEGKKKKKKKKNAEKSKEEDLKSYSPVSIGEVDGTYYAFSKEENEKRSIYLVNYLEMTAEKIFTTSAYEISNVYVDSKNRFIGARVNRDGYYVDEMNEPGSSEDAKDEQLENIFDESLDESKALVYSVAHNQPGKFEFVNFEENKRHTVSRSRPKLPAVFPSLQVEDRVESHGEDIPYILNLPNTNHRHPLVVTPHGGPIGVHDSPYFDSVVQFLVANGFAVLRVNYRGSSGYSSEFEDLGAKEWGAKILDDIIAATKEVHLRGDIEASRSCIFGGSYGGYAAAELLTRYPTLFKCGVSHAGVYDLPLYIQFNANSEARAKWAREHIGDVANEYESLKNISPLYHVQDLTRPIMIVHGAEDDVVDKEQYFRYKMTLQNLGKEFEFLFEPDLGHHYVDEKLTTKTRLSI